MQFWTCNGGANQSWTAQSDGTLRNAQTGKCLDVSGNNSADGTVVHQWTCIADAANQKWTCPDLTGRAPRALAPAPDPPS